MGKNSKRMKIDGRTYRAALDKFLADKQLKRKFIAKDGSCLFRAVSEQVSCGLNLWVAGVIFGLFSFLGVWWSVLSPQG